MKYIIFLLACALQLAATMPAYPLTNVSEGRAEIEIQKIDAGVSGFVIRNFNDAHSAILSRAVVESFDPQTKKAVLTLTPFEMLSSNNLPKGTWKAKEGDSAILAYGYKRALLVAPTEDIYYRITKSVPSLQWIHPDIFATILSYEGHPTPLKEDFDIFTRELAVGLLYLYLDERLYTLDSNTFAILDIIDAPLTQETDALKLPFYTRVEEIDANWFGEGSDELESYEPYYYELMARHNPHNKKLYDIIKNLQLDEILDEFEIKE